VVIIGYHLAQNLGVTVGQEITLISPQGRDTVAGFIPRIKSFTVVAIFDVGMYEYDSAYVFMPLEAAQLYFMLPQQASQIEISVDDPDRTGAAAAAILARTGNGYRLTDWKEANASFFGAIEVEGNVMFLILTLIIIVAAFNIISSQIMLVKEKGRAIAILRTMGATRGMILRIFLSAAPASAWWGRSRASPWDSPSPTISSPSGRGCRACCTRRCFRRRSISCRSFPPSSIPGRSRRW
jgi:ABC-type transport system, involved in lipoprotein release, permease component